MTASREPNLFAKNMGSNTKRLIQHNHLQQQDVRSWPHRKMRLTLSLKPKSHFVRCEHDDNTAKISSSSDETLVSNRLSGGMPYKNNNNEQVNTRHRWRSPIGTIADHRMTNNNRIHKQWHTFAVTLLSLFLCIVQVTVVNGHPDPVPTPIRVSHSYTKTVSNTIPTSTTSRSTTQITSFLPSDAISSLSSSVINYKNYNAFAGNRSSNSGGSSFGSSIYNSFKNVTSAIGSKSHYNANIQSSSRRSSASNKEFSPSSPVTSIDRPFYTKISTTDAIAMPSHYNKHHTKSASKKTKKGKHSSKSSTFGKYSKTKGSKEQAFSSTSVEDIDNNNNNNAFMPHTTEKSYHPPKLSLEPFFNFLTSLATASREVIMSKEQHHQNNNNNEHQSEYSHSFTTSGEISKYSPSYEAINQSMREGAKKAKKSKKGSSSKSKKKSKGHGKGDKKGNKGGSKRQRTKSAESMEDEEEFELDQPIEGPVPISLPNPIIDSPEDAKEDDSPSDGMENSVGQHILDVLRTPLIPDYESPPSPAAARAEPLVALSDDFQETSGGSGSSSSFSSSSTSNSGIGNGSKAQKSLHSSNTSLSSSSSSASVNPPSGRANINKGQGYMKFDKYEGPGTQNVSGSMIHKQQREKQRSERDPMDTYHDQHAQESINHAQVVPSPFGMNNNDANNDDLTPTSYQFHQQQHQQYPQQHQQQQPKINNEPSLASTSQQVSILPHANSPEFAVAGKSSATGLSVESNGFVGGQIHANGKNDFVSKYPTTFVYQSNPQSGPPPPGPRPYMLPSPPPGYPMNNVVVYGSPTPPVPSSRPPFRMNKLRPNLHSYYDSSYHNYAGVGESQVASEMIGIRHPYGPPHFKPPPHAMHSPLPPPPRFVNGYGNRPGFMMMPHRGTHYVGHTLNAAPSPNPITKPFDRPNADYPQDLTGGNGNNNNNENSSVGNQDTSGTDATGSGSDNIDQYTLSEIDDNSVTAAENSENKKVGIMDSFDLFYKEYKILTWVAVFFVTSMALLTLLVYLYINNPPTEVVQARQLFPWTDLLNNPQITRFLSSLTESSTSGNRMRKKDGTASNNDEDDEYIKPYGNGFGGKSGKATRKQTRIQQDKAKFVRRINKLKRQKASKQNGDTSTTVSPSSGDKITPSGNK